MPRKRQNPDFTHLSDTGTSSKANRLKLESERQAAARETRAQIVKETRKAQKDTAEFLASKPTDSRTIAPRDPNAGIL